MNPVLTDEAIQDVDALCRYILDSENEWQTLIESLGEHDVLTEDELEMLQNRDDPEGVEAVLEKASKSGEVDCLVYFAAWRMANRIYDK